ncbi:type IV toxin-antitoxin system AbiEi family antitoxin domain-containing protein [Streptomyces lonegramiae]|uniref:Type IV toxin-antitoxin system AbiEi family antitoxin domain-containing protein n=1 Tax=Streptomyces lonegramiae TaxID=3075524 RepID=A0ABU2XU96_9ACTN|nr:type IV toxin-antitoxin system AbiEi family antitoxin domain-containing protein [Streptomyces sp. DSM 41529]MDT0549498.1 type IV toxin-antitoxin system AbiEi family antitoxin domain-containing protein [Streptomyces sp. DSM 41529]
MTRTGEPVSLTGLAGAQGGVVLTAQALAGGWDRRQLNRCLLGDGWTRIGRGIWAEPGRAVDGVTLLWANQLAHPQLVVSHTAAAVLHDIETSAQCVEFIGPCGRRPTMHGGVLHRLPLGAEEITTLAGLRVTTVARTMADLLRAGPRDEALVAVESAVSRRPSRDVDTVGRRREPCTTLGEIARPGERGCAPGHEGSTRMAGDGGSEGWLACGDDRPAADERRGALRGVTGAAHHPGGAAALP